MRLTPKYFSADSSVRVLGPCREDDWTEDSLTWRTMPETFGTTICTWTGDDTKLYYEEPLECDVTTQVRGVTGNTGDGIICFRLDEAPSETTSRRGISFYSREVEEPDTQSVERFGTPYLGKGSVVGRDPTIRPHLIIAGTGCGEFPDHEQDSANC